MKTIYAPQYDTQAVIVDDGADYDTVVQACRGHNATFYEDGPDDECFVVVLRPEVGPELYTPRALRGSLGRKG